MGLDPIVDHMRMVADHDQWVHINALNITFCKINIWQKFTVHWGIYFQ